MFQRIQVQERRKSLRVSLDALAVALGAGFSRARLSAWERGVARLSESEITMVAAAVERIGKHHASIRALIAQSNQIDLADLCSDIRLSRSL